MYTFLTCTYIFFKKTIEMSQILLYNQLNICDTSKNKTRVYSQYNILTYYYVTFSL